jgi:hypothetical protein
MGMEDQIDPAPHPSTFDAADGRKLYSVLPNVGSWHDSDVPARLPDVRY